MLVTRTDVPLRRTMEVLIPVQFFIRDLQRSSYLMLLILIAHRHQLFMGAFGLERRLSTSIRIRG